MDPRHFLEASRFSAGHIDDLHCGPDFVGPPAQPTENSRRILEIARLAENLSVDRDHGVCGEDYGIRRDPGDDCCFAGRVPDCQLTDREPTVRDFIDRRRDDLKFIAGFAQKLASARRSGSENETRPHAITASAEQTAQSFPPTSPARSGSLVLENPSAAKTRCRSRYRS